MGNLVQEKVYLLKDLKQILFSPKKFFQDRFLGLSSKRIFALGFLGVTIGLLLGGIFTYSFSHVAFFELSGDNLAYRSAIDALGLKQDDFIDLLKVQQAYGLLVSLLSPIIAYVAPHLLGGALFLLLWLGVRSQGIKITFARIMECSAIALASMAYYALPGIGPLLALIMVGINLARALSAQYQMTGFFKVTSIFCAIYLSVLLMSSSLQLLAVPLANL